MSDTDALPDLPRPPQETGDVAALFEVQAERPPGLPPRARLDGNTPHSFVIEPETPGDNAPVFNVQARDAACPAGQDAVQARIRTEFEQAGKIFLQPSGSGESFSLAAEQAATLPSPADLSSFLVGYGSFMAAWSPLNMTSWCGWPGKARS